MQMEKERLVQMRPVNRLADSTDGESISPFCWKITSFVRAKILMGEDHDLYELLLGAKTAYEHEAGSAEFPVFIQATSIPPLFLYGLLHITFLTLPYKSFLTSNSPNAGQNDEDMA